MGGQGVCVGAGGVREGIQYYTAASSQLDDHRFSR